MRRKLDPAANDLLDHDPGSIFGRNRAAPVGRHRGGAGIGNEGWGAETCTVAG
jgi:hypothetical protein